MVWAVMPGAFMLLGAVLFLMFGFIHTCRPPESLQDDYSETLGAIARFMWPVGLAIMMVSAVVWLLAL